MRERFDAGPVRLVLDSFTDAFRLGHRRSGRRRKSENSNHSTFLMPCSTVPVVRNNLKANILQAALYDTITVEAGSDVAE